MGKKINTVTGIIDSEKMGFTTVHEHVSLEPVESKTFDDTYHYNVNILKDAKAKGIQTIVDVTPERNAEVIKRASEESEVNLIVCTGHYIFFNDEEKKYSIDDFKKVMMNEIEFGIGKTGIYPGVIKLSAMSEKITPYERNLFIAGGIVSKETGVPICTHACAGAKEQQDLLEEAGADLSKVYFSHIEAEFGWEGRTLEQQLDYLEKIVKKGSSISYNNFGNWAHTKPETLIAIIKAMNARGYSNNQLATMDMVIKFENGKRSLLWEDINEDGPIRTYSYLVTHAIPWMLSNGVAQEDINKMFLDNPFRIFS